MTLSELFNIPESKEDFHTEYFPTKLMDSEVWTFPITDKGINGIEILEKEYGLWSDVVKQNNLGRVFGTNQAKVKQFLKQEKV